jgi:hypothetical protein
MRDNLDKALSERFALQHDELPVPDFADVLRRATQISTRPVSRSDVLRRAGEAPTRPARRFTRPRLAIGLALTACVAVAVPAVVFSGLFASSATPAPRGKPGGGHPLGYQPMALDFTRGSEGITSIRLTVNAPTRDATTLLQVITGSPYGHIVSPATRKVVFQEQVPMTNIADPAQGPNGTVALSTWSGTLAPGDWDGGCQHGPYEVYATTVTSGASFDNPPDGSQIGGSQWFTCSSG